MLHANADIADAVLRYVAATGDEEFLAEVGVDLLVETARLWHRFGHWSDTGTFHLHGVTGPDEYAALVNDNLFTHPRSGGPPPTPCSSRTTASAVCTSRPPASPSSPSGDFASTSEDDYPLLPHFPYLELYRKQVVKQADLVLAMLRCPGEFTADEKARNVAYYEARTVRDSSLSASAQAVLAAEVGHLDLAYDLFAETALQDLEGLGDKTGDGLHLASLAGAWLVVAQGFGGLRDDRGVLSFDPRLPRRIRRLAFSLRWHGHRLRVTLTPDGARYELPDAGPEVGIDLWHHGEPVRVTGAAAVTRLMPPVPDPGPEPSSPPGRRPARRSAG